MTETVKILRFLMDNGKEVTVETLKAHGIKWLTGKKIPVIRQMEEDGLVQSFYYLTEKRYSENDRCKIGSRGGVGNDYNNLKLSVRTYRITIKGQHFLRNALT